VVVYAYDRDEPDKRAVARAVLSGTSAELTISTQVLLEFYWTSTRKLRRPMAADQASEVVESLRQLTVVGADDELVCAAIALARERQLALWDALIVRAAQRGGCDRLLTEDLQDGARFGELTVENPFS
jgi:predicted nucleic acid-binding protein